MRDIAGWLDSGAGFLTTAAGAFVVQFLVYFPYDCGGLSVGEAQLAGEECKTFFLGIPVSPSIDQGQAGLMATFIAFAFAGLLYGLAHLAARTEN